MQSPFISRVVINNFRNFKEIDVELSHKQIIIGENNVGKTNFLRALQLILDPSFSDEDRMLDEADFFNGLENPMESGEIITIQIYIDGYSHNKNIIAQLSDATVSVNGKEYLTITYKYHPVIKESGKIEYQYSIFKGNDPKKFFKHDDRKYLNIKVIKAIRDVENELRNTKYSPISKLIKKYSIEKDDLKEIAERLKEESADILALDEVVDLEQNINSKFTKILGIASDLDISLKTMDIDPSRLLNSLQVLLSGRQPNNTSLGLTNILYISLVLLLLRDTTIPTFLRNSKYAELKKNDGLKLLDSTYHKNSNDNFTLNPNISSELKKKLYDFMDKYSPSCEGTTILAIEEPEAHLHPTIQRLIYKHVIKENDSSVLLTTHSTHISSIASLKSLVHLCKKPSGGTKINSTAKINLSNTEIEDIERYIDVKRGEIYLGKGVILVEGIAEEYLIPKFAEILGMPLDEKGIIVCNIGSTNFKPYVVFLKMLNVPYVVVTDGDFYYKNVDGTKEYHVIYSKEDTRDLGYLGMEIISDLLISIENEDEDIWEKEIDVQDNIMRSHGYFVSSYTLEVEVMDSCQNNETAKNIFYNTFEELTNGGDIHKKNFKSNFTKGEYFKCLNAIENNGIGKGRFAQRLSSVCVEKHIPEYIKLAIEYINKKVDEC